MLLAGRPEGFVPVGQRIDQPWRDVTGEICARPLGLDSCLERFLQNIELIQALLDRDDQVLKVDGLGHEVERAPVHGGANILQITIGRNDDGLDPVLEFGQMLEQGQPVHARHVDVADDEIDVAVGFDLFEPLLAVPGEVEDELAVADLAPELALDQLPEVALIIYD